MGERESDVLVRIGRNSGPMHAAVLNALDCPVADRLVGAGLAFRGVLDGWYGLTERGVREAERALEHGG